MSAPSQRIWPELAGNRPASIFTVVDLPLPLGPRYPVTWPGGTVNVTWSTTARLRYFFVSPRTSNIALLLVAELDTVVAELFRTAILHKLWGSQSWLQPAFQPALPSTKALSRPQKSRLERRLRARLPAPEWVRESSS